MGGSSHECKGDRTHVTFDHIIGVWELAIRDRYMLFGDTPVERLNGWSMGDTVSEEGNDSRKEGQESEALEDFLGGVFDSVKSVTEKENNSKEGDKGDISSLALFVCLHSGLESLTKDFKGIRASKSSH